jgi:hypothetical protein
MARCPKPGAKLNQLNQPNPTTTTMSEEIVRVRTTLEVTDEQLEEVSGGLFDNNSCNAGIIATANVL